MKYETRELLLKGELSLNDAIEASYEKMKFLKSDDDDYKKTDEILRDLLEIKYQDEFVLVVKLEDIPEDVLSIMECKEIFLKDVQIMDEIKSNLFFIERWKAEFNPNYKQIIPYVAIQRKNQIFITKRLGGDPRLVNRYSIGLGGHVNKVDERKEGLIMSCIKRELTEELHIDLNDIKDKNLKGFLYNQCDDVGKDHLGLAYSVILKDDAEVSIKETDSLEGDFYTIDSTVFKEDLFGPSLNREVFELFDFHKDDLDNIPYKFKGREFNRFYSLISEELSREASVIPFNKIMEIFNNARKEFQEINVLKLNQKDLFKYDNTSAKLNDLHYNLRLIALNKFEDWSNAFLEKLI